MLRRPVADGGQPGLCFGEVWSGAGEDILLDDCSVAPAIGSSSSTNCNRSSVSRQRAEDLADEFGW
ncbi:hypothetical protein [Pseudomonas aeruginosa]|uniref:hypothetical protein n=1 Tax=Pseudomonas aeruginosa TaxID=287 RepID=UPI001D00586E